MKKLNDLGRSNEKKEFHRIVGSILHVRRNAFLINEERHPFDSNEMVFNREEMNRLISEKYRGLSASESTRPLFEVSEIRAATLEGVCCVVDLVSSENRLHPDTILKISDPRIIAKLTSLINRSFWAEKYHPRIRPAPTDQ